MRFLHVGINFHAGAPKMKELEPTFNAASDWLRYAPNCWILYTSETAETWAHRIHAAIGEMDSIFVFEVDIRPEHRYGYLPQTLWNWVHKVASYR